MAHEVAKEDQSGERVDVHAELEEGEGVARDEGEDAVEAGELVEEEGEGDDFGTEAEGGYEEECLVHVVSDYIE